LDSYGIFKQADDLVKQCGTRNVEYIISDLGITLYIEEGFNDLLGMYTYQWKHRMMFLNARLQGYLKYMVMAHELGHDQRHRNIAGAGRPLKEFSLFQMKDTTEYEANAFATHILLENEEVYALARQGCDVFSIAQQLDTDVNLMLIKMQEMNNLGYDFTVPLQHDSRFFRKIKGSGISNYE
jgi:Zn-dependent peptidase ImmA (M78 family)